MLGLFVLGIGLVAGLYLLARVFVAADPRTLARAVRWGGLGIGAVAVLVLLVTGRLGTAIAIGAFLLPFLTHWRSIGNRMRAARGPRAGQTSRIETLYLRMILDHDTGAMTGEVLHGAFAGRSLDGLDRRQRLALLDECRRGDAHSASVLEAWLDREQPDWREGAGGAGGGGSSGGSDGRSGGGAMTRDEAADILGVAPDAPPQAVKEAHRRLMMKVHPDHGGSTYLAAKINQAKDLLLKR